MGNGSRSPGLYKQEFRAGSRSTKQSAGFRIFNADNSASVDGKAFQIAERLSAFKNAEGHIFIRNNIVFIAVGHNLDEETVIGAALMQLTGRVLEARTEAEGCRAAAYHGNSGTQFLQ